MEGSYVKKDVQINLRYLMVKFEMDESVSLCSITLPKSSYACFPISKGLVNKMRKIVCSVF